ncbi:MAG: hypothetical protein AUJ56_05810 [Zetaproteobacteria bacterium CG1_02_49_23]|nr:MAG: hypothetical protein AUJ56_05810 [Zetaproteobacteria bacterium CG1_02_49_23]
MATETSASSTPMTLDQTLRRVLSIHPDVALSAIREDISKSNRNKIEGMLDPSFSVTSGLSDEKKPTTSLFAASGSNTARIQGQINQPLKDGSLLSGQWSYTRARQSYPATMPTAFLPTINPTYSSQIDLMYRYPILQGHDNPAYNFQAEALDAEVELSRASLELQKETLINQTIQAFFQVSIDQINVGIAKEALKRTDKLLSYQKKREVFGLIEEADLLQTQALKEKSRFNLQQASSTLSNDYAFLNRLMIRDIDTPLSIEAPRDIEKRLNDSSLNMLLRNGSEKRAIFKSLQARMKSAEARLSIAEDSDKMKLDVTGQAGTRALEAGRGQAFANGFRIQDRFIGINLELSDTIVDHAGKAGIQKAILDLEELKLAQIQAHENIKTEISTSFNALENDRKKLSAAYRQAKAEKRKYDAELERYQQGRTDLATVLQFESDLNNANLMAALQRIQIQMSAVHLLFTAGLISAETLGK